MSSIIKTIEYHKGETKEFLKSISYGGDLYSILNDSFVFRGHSQSIYELKPAALRNKEILDAEKLKTNKDTKKISEFLQIHSEKTYQKRLRIFWWVSCATMTMAAKRIPR